MSDSKKPIIGITMGDPVGVGPEVIVKALADGSLDEICCPVIIGDIGVLERALLVTKVLLPIQDVKNLKAIQARGKSLNVLACSRLDMKETSYGRPTAITGKAMVEYILTAARSAMGKEIDAVVTGPINKAAMALAGYHYPGHTELLAEETKTKDFAMMLAGERLRVVLVTTHHALREVPGLLCAEKVLSSIRLSHRTMKHFFGIAEPVIAVAALNPHAGEQGMFGEEERQIIGPAIEQARSEGIDAAGPFASDSLFFHAARGAYDVVVSMYHDQGLIPLKLLHFDDAVNVTLGLPIIRTSVDHGTAYDIAGTGKANPASLRNAVQLAVQMAKFRAP